MARRDRNRRRTTDRRARGRSAGAQPAAARPPQPRPHFHYERIPGYLGDYEVQLTLLDLEDGRQAVIGRVRAPGGQAFELTRHEFPAGAPRLVSDATQGFGPPPGLDPRLLHDMLLECRGWAFRDNVRRKLAMKAEEQAGSG